MTRSRLERAMVDEGRPTTYIFHVMWRLGMVAFVLVGLTGCGVSPELVDEPEVPETPVPSTDDDGQRQTRDWQCAGSTAATRQQGRMARHRGVEGFASRNCVAPATEVELNPNP